MPRDLRALYIHVLKYGWKVVQPYPHKPYFLQVYASDTKDYYKAFDVILAEKE
ncbi:hypothetical protein LCGC14_1536040 [marine sediment metagenome]|uniref:Uncharacterized protein n=1 Tax=marine sediment metagenome TaxID=412755 RepID=A0A0F9IUI2_9ZZZZ